MKDKDIKDFVSKVKEQTAFILENVSKLKDFGKDALDLSGDNSKELKEAREVALKKMEELKVKHSELIDKINSFK